MCTSVVIRMKPIICIVLPYKCKKLLLAFNHAIQGNTFSLNNRSLSMSRVCNRKIMIPRFISVWNAFHKKHYIQ